MPTRDRYPQLQHPLSIIMSRSATNQYYTAKRSQGNSSYAAGGFAAPNKNAGTNIEEEDATTAPLSAALLSQYNCFESLPKIYTPFPLPFAKIFRYLCNCVNFYYIEDSTTGTKSNLCHVTSSSREEHTPSIVRTAKSDVQDGGLILPSVTPPRTWNTSYLSDMVVGIGRTLYYTTTICQDIVHDLVKYNITIIRLTVNILVAAFEAATFILLFRPLNWNPMVLLLPLLLLCVRVHLHHPTCLRHPGLPNKMREE